MAVYSFFQTFIPLIQRNASSYKTVFRIINLTEPLLKSIHALVSMGAIFL